jgi:L-fuconolactonase
LAETVDAHHHLWKYSPEEYGWIDESMAVLRRDFVPEDLTRELAIAGVDGAVTVQARQTLEETKWLLELGERCDRIRGVVGWAPIVEPGFLEVFNEVLAHPKLKGLRHVIQAEEDENYILRKDFNSGVQALQRTGMVYDILIYERHLPQTIEFVDRHPNQVFVLDHVAKPRIREGVMEPWASNMRELARRQNVCCKLSGMVTEDDWSGCSIESLRPYLDVVVEAFGPTRLMAGSDWPVCLVACGYSEWFRVLREYFGRFSDTEKERIFGLTATEVYRLR